MIPIPEIEFVQTPEEFSSVSRISAHHKDNIVGYCNLLRYGDTVKIADIIIYDHRRPFWKLFPYFKTGKNYRSRGFGSALLKHAIKYCKDRNIVEILGNAQGDLDVLIPWYEKHGFTVGKGNKLHLKLTE